MAIRSMLGAAAVLLAGIASAAPTNCMAPVRVISVRGTNEVFGQSTLKGLFSDILGNGIGAVLQGTPYPAVMDDANWGVYGGSVTAGVQSLQGIIAGAVQQCPNQKLVLVGYSQVSTEVSQPRSETDHST